MLSPKPMRGLQRLCEWREHTRSAAYSRAQRAQAQAEQQKADNESEIADTQAARLAVFANMRGDIDLAELHRMKRQEGFLTHRLNELLWHARSLDTALADACDDTHEALTALIASRRRREKIDHVTSRMKAQANLDAARREEHELEDQPLGY